MYYSWENKLVTGGEDSESSLRAELIKSDKFQLQKIFHILILTSHIGQQFHNMQCPNNENISFLETLDWDLTPA